MKLTKQQKDDFKKALNPIVNESTVEPIAFADLQKEARRKEIFPVNEEIIESIKGFLVKR